MLAGFDRRAQVLRTEPWRRAEQDHIDAAFDHFLIGIQSAELRLGRDIDFRADALQAGRLVRISPMALHDSDATTYWFVHPLELAEWPPLAALRRWLHDEMALSRKALDTLQPVVA